MKQGVSYLVQRAKLVAMIVRQIVKYAPQENILLQERQRVLYAPVGSSILAINHRIMLVKIHAQSALQENLLHFQAQGPVQIALQEPI